MHHTISHLMKTLYLSDKWVEFLGTLQLEDLSMSMTTNTMTTTIHNDSYERDTHAIMTLLAKMVQINTSFFLVPFFFHKDE